MKGKTKTNS